jgi:hypothetical protein
MRQSLEISEIWGGFWWEGAKETERFANLDLDSRVILKWILKKEDRRTRTGLI